MNASSKPFPLSFSTSFFAFSCFLEAKTWIVYAASSVVAEAGFVTAGSSAASGIFGVSTMEVSDFGTSGVFGLGVSFVVSSVFSGEADFGFSGVTGSGFSGVFNSGHFCQFFSLLFQVTQFLQINRFLLFITFTQSEKFQVFF